jgi:uncharacterized protein YjbJ (UPF0337 family)
MNNNVVEGKWKQLRGQAKVWWGNLTHNNREKVGGKFDTMIGRLQEKVGETQQQVTEGIKKEQNDNL